MSRLLAALTAGLVATAAVADDEPVRVVVPGFVAHGALDEGTEGVLVDMLLTALHGRHDIQALGPDDIQKILSVEQQAQLLGCSDEGCLAELAGALNASKLISGSVGQLGKLYIVTLKLINTDDASVDNRLSRNLKSIEEITVALGPMVDDLIRGHLDGRAATPAAGVSKHPEGSTDGVARSRGPPTAAQTDYRKEVEFASQIVKRALQAARDNNDRRFRTLHHEKAADAELSLPHAIRHLSRAIRGAKQTSLCPYNDMDESVVEAAANRLQVAGELEVCYQFVGKDRSVSRGRVILLRTGVGWRIAEWILPKPDGEK